MVRFKYKGILSILTALLLSTCSQLHSSHTTCQAIIIIINSLIVIIIINLIVIIIITKS